MQPSYYFAIIINIENKINKIHIFTQATGLKDVFTINLVNNTNESFPTVTE